MARRQYGVEIGMELPRFRLVPDAHAARMAALLTVPRVAK